MSIALKRGALGLVDLFQLATDQPVDQPRVPPTEFRIFRAGKNSTTKGEFLFDSQAAAMVMAAYERHGVDLMIDWDHHALLTGQGVKAPAAGWFGLEVRNGDLMAVNVKWSDEGAEDLKSGAYRYFSPLFDFDPGTGRVACLINLALTGTPAMDDIAPLVAASALRHPIATATAGEPNMNDLEKAQARIVELERINAAQAGELERLKPAASTVVALSTAVGLAPTAAGVEIQGAIVALSRFRDEVLKVAGKDDPAAALGALNALVEKAQAADGLQTRIEQVEMAALSSGWKGHLDSLATNGDGKGRFLTPAKRDRAEKMAIDFGGGKLTEQGIKCAKEYLSDILETRQGGSFTAPGSNLAISPEQQRTNALMGISQTAFVKFQETQVAAGRR